MAIFTVTNTSDSGTGSLRQAILDSNAAGGNNTIEFDPALTGQTITILSALPISTNTIINADINNDLVVNDITIATDRFDFLFTLDVDGVSLSNSFATIDYDNDDATGGFPSAIYVTADNASFENLGNINVSGVPFGNNLDSISAIIANADNFTLTNEGSIVTTGRFTINAIQSDVDGFVDIYTTVLNNGLLQSTDDAIRLTTGLVENNGTIRTTGTFGSAADGISIIGPQNSDFISPNAEASTIINNGIIEGHRFGIFFNGDGSITNTNRIEAETSAIFAQGNSTGLDGNVLGLTSDFVLNNSGTLIRNNEQLNGNAAIGIGFDLNSAIITLSLIHI